MTKKRKIQPWMYGCTNNCTDYIGEPIGVFLVDENGVRYGKKKGKKIVPFDVKGFVVTDKELLKMINDNKDQSND